MVDLLDFQNVNDRHRHVDVDWDHCFENFVKTERGNFLVVVVLGKTNINTKVVLGEKKI